MPSIIVFSKDRPMQLHAYLESLFLFSDAQAKNVTVLFKETPEIDYSRVIDSFSSVNWVREDVFHSDLLKIINQSDEYIMFGCDDVVFTGPFNLDFAKNILQENADIFGFSFRLGNNIQPQPKESISFGGYRSWQWSEISEPHYNYPWELDSTLYRKSDILDMLIAHGANIRSPNYFEGDFAVNVDKYISRKQLACLTDKSKAIVITVNAVQDTHQNGFDSKKSTDIYSLNDLYNRKNNKLDVHAIAALNNRHIHVGSEYFLLENYDKNWEKGRPTKIAPKKSNPIKLFFKNIGYLFKYDLKKVARDSITMQELNLILDGYSYELDGCPTKFRRPKIKNAAETIEELIIGNSSLCRFGDGEFSLINGEDIAFQKSDPLLARRLRAILQSGEKDILIGIPYCYFSSLEDLREFPKSFIRTWVARNREGINDLLIPAKQYYDTACTQLYALYESYDFKSYFSKIKEIWMGRDLAIICGNTVFDVIDTNIFDCAKSIEYQFAPSLNAFEKYDELLAKAKQISKNKLIIIILGPTATVMAYDLALAGYRALDFGHIAKDYDFFRKKIKHNSETISNFLRPD